MGMEPTRWEAWKERIRETTRYLKRGKVVKRGKYYKPKRPEFGEAWYDDPARLAAYKIKRRRKNKIAYASRRRHSANNMRGLRR